MLISEFAKVTGLSVDTVRFYIRKGLITPTQSEMGGRNPYQVFNDEHVSSAKLIKFCQSLGMSLKEIVFISEEQRKGRITRERSIEFMNTQLKRLDAKSAELATMSNYLRSKIAWMENGGKGTPPDFEKFATGTKNPSNCE
ncbi:MerR family transcriptional regulator [soil metagenome]